MDQNGQSNEQLSALSTNDMKDNSSRTVFGFSRYEEPNPDPAWDETHYPKYNSKSPSRTKEYRFISLKAMNGKPHWYHDGCTLSSLASSSSSTNDLQNNKTTVFGFDTTSDNESYLAHVQSEIADYLKEFNKSQTIRRENGHISLIKTVVDYIPNPEYPESIETIRNTIQSRFRN